MTVPTTKSNFWRGFRDGSPFIFGAVPFGVVFGVTATDAGLNLWETMSMTILVIAGAAQIAALSQMQLNAPVVLVVAAALAVNLRMAMYSASIAPHLGKAPLWQRAIASYILVDNSYAVGIAEFEARPNQSTSDKMAYYVGCSIPVWVFWYAASFAGAVLGQALPSDIGLDFVVPLAFLAIVTPMVRTFAHFAAAAVSVMAALAFSFLPFNSGLLIAAALAMITGAAVETLRGAKP